MGEHTKEPWRVSGCGDEIYAANPVFDKPMVAVSARIPSYAGGSEVAKANLSRAAVCVNACAGIPTADLAQPVYPAAVVRRLVEAAGRLVARINEHDQHRRNGYDVLASAAADDVYAAIPEVQAALADVERVGKSHTQEPQQ